MAGEGRAPADPVSVLDRLREEPWRFGFFQALRRLESLYRDKPLLGTSVRVADDPVRLAQDPSLAFAPSTLASFKPGEGEGDPHRLAVYFLGMFGPNGPLPLHLTEYARDRLRNADDPTFARFMDVFHHRMLSLFYRAWADGQPAVSFDRDDTDQFALHLASLVGLGMESLRDRDAMPDLAKLHWSGHLVCQTRNADGLASMLSGFFEMPVDLEPFIGQWIDLPERTQMRLGETPETGTLGLSSTIGARVWDCQTKFRVIFGPLSLEDYERMLPGSDSLLRLIALARNYIGDEFVWDVNLILKKEEVPPLILGRQGRLGLTSWLWGGEAPHDLDDLKLNPLGTLG